MGTKVSEDSSSGMGRSEEVGQADLDVSNPIRAARIWSKGQMDANTVRPVNYAGMQNLYKPLVDIPQEVKPGAVHIYPDLAKIIRASEDAMLGGVGAVRIDPSSMLKDGVKGDNGKSPIVAGALHYFPRALLAVAELSAYGAKKYSLTYSDRNFARVANGYQRYSDALARHMLQEQIDANATDPESGFMHDVHVAWNALARLEYRLEQMKDAK